MSEDLEKERLEKELADSERERLIREQMKIEAPTLADKLKAVSEELEAMKAVQKKTEQLIDIMSQQVMGISEEQAESYRKLMQIVPKVAEVART